MPKIGERDQRVTLKSPSVENQSGNPVTVYTAVETVWARVIAPRGNEALEAGRINARRSIRLRIPWRDDVTTKWVVTWQGQDYNIVDRDGTERRMGNLWLTATASEVS